MPEIGVRSCPSCQRPALGEERHCLRCGTSLKDVEVGPVEPPESKGKIAVGVTIAICTLVGAILGAAAGCVSAQSPFGRGGFDHGAPPGMFLVILIDGIFRLAVGLLVGANVGAIVGAIVGIIVRKGEDQPPVRES